MPPVAAPPQQIDDHALEFDRTVHRALVHRRALAEVFLTDAVRVADDRFLAAAQLPRAHWCYTDHTAAPAQVDPMLLLECCRQASTLLVHRFLDLPFGTAFLVKSWRTRITDPDALVSGPTPGELRLDIRTAGARSRDGQLRSLTLDIGLQVDGAAVGESHIQAGYLPAEDYAALRTLRRRSPAPMSDELAPRTGAQPVQPALVGRRDPRNVVLAEAHVAGPTATARVDVPLDHASLFDHPLDHVPGMALLEAARQMAVLLTGEPRVTGLDAAFVQFAELDSPLTVTATQGERIDVEVSQNGTAVCTVKLER
ncbi:ScbA/BarX family gamma-butyrolactone biosynthesis protein [Micromonospora lupini]|uniref:ScbA/BarX family gamma-butyrolactone biosynthesis protein n=1 Tax=Micromonospora lupini TaxID=285679 RepID=UPI0031D35289